MAIQTFVFLDLETTGLITKHEMPKVTELSLVAVDRNVILNNEQPVPRILSKLVLPIHPNKRIPQNVQLLTKIYEIDLNKAKHFDQETYHLIQIFINRLTQPVCFVAHNGNGFDYPIFLSELRCINKELDGNILCIDTLCMFKDFFQANQNQQSSVEHHASNTETFMEELNDGYDELLSKTLDDVISNMKLTNNVCDLTHPSTILYEILSENRGWLEVQKKNETTPKTQITTSETDIGLKHKGGARKKLNFAHGKPHNFKLTTIHEHMIGVIPVDAHSAEGDCLAMLRCVSKIKQFFIEWADGNAVPLIKYKMT